MRKMKGLEPIVAAILLIVVAVIGAILIYLWFSGFVTRGASQAEQLAAGAEKLKIEAASLDSSVNPPQAVLYVRNLGGVNATISTGYLLLPGTLSVHCINQTITTQDGDAEVGANSLESVTIQFEAGCTVTGGQDYVVKIVTERGTEFAVTVTAS